MKKSLLALAALSAFATAAQAQSSVSVYGILDMGYNSTKYENNGNVAGANGKTSSMGALSALSSSRIGFRGTEDLGGGLSANFVLELGFLAQNTNAPNTTTANTTDSGTNLDTAADKARTFTVGLSDKALGTVRIGRDKAPAQLATEKYTAGGANNSVGEFFMFGASAVNFGGGENAADLDITSDTFGERVSGGLFYTSPTMNGFTLNAVVGNDKNQDTDGAASQNRQVKHQGISVAYEGVQNLSLTYAMHNRDVRGVADTAAAEDEYQTFGASYKLGNVQLFGQWVDAEKTTKTGTQTSKTDGYQIGVGYTMGKTYLWAQMGDSESEGTTRGTKEYDREGYQVGVRYDLSKRTSVYGIYGAQEAKKVGSTAVNEVSALNLGVRHSF
jgi:predicted porin